MNTRILYRFIKSVQKALDPGIIKVLTLGAGR